MIESIFVFSLLHFSLSMFRWITAQIVIKKPLETQQTFERNVTRGFAVFCSKKWSRRQRVISLSKIRTQIYFHQMQIAFFVACSKKSADNFHSYIYFSYREHSRNEWLVFCSREVIVSTLRVGQRIGRISSCWLPKGKVPDTDKEENVWWIAVLTFGSCSAFINSPFTMQTNDGGS